MSARTRRARRPRSRRPATPPAAPKIKPENVKLLQMQHAYIVQVVDEEGQTVGPPITVPESDHFFPGDKQRARTTFRQFLDQRMPLIVDAVRRAHEPSDPEDSDIRPSG